MQTVSRRLEDCPSVIYIVYTPGAHAEAAGYEDWLVKVDNPFFNAIPGVHHYANWRLEQVLTGAPPYAYFDFQGLAASSDLERVWFNPELDHFRTEWVRLWGYTPGADPAMQANAYVMRPIRQRPIHWPTAQPTRFAVISGGKGDPPAGTHLAWRIEETIRKHYAMGPAGPAWRLPATTENPLGLDWIGLTYGDDPGALAASYVLGRESIAFVARLIAAPGGG